MVDLNINKHKGFMNDEKLVKAITELVYAIRGGCFMIFGGICLHAAVGNNHPENGIIGSITQLIEIGGASIPIFFGIKMMHKR